MRLVTTDIGHHTSQAPYAPSSREEQTLATSRRHAPLRQRGASLMESSIAVGLVGIAVFATVSSFGGDISSRISHGILPSLNGGVNPGMSGGEPVSKESSPLSSSAPQPAADYDTGDGVGGISNEGDSLVGGIDAQPPEDEDNTGSSSSSQSDDYTFVGGTDASPPVDGEEGAADTGSSSVSMNDSFVGGTDAIPSVVDGANESSASSTP